jgi:hypothetical protein
MWALSAIVPVALLVCVCTEILNHPVSELMLWAGFAPPVLVAFAGTTAAALRTHRRIIAIYDAHRPQHPQQ